MISSKETLQATTLQGCRYPHTLSCSPHKVSSHERLGLLVELSAFLHCAEALDLQFLPCKDFFLLTTRPCLFMIKEAAVKPPLVLPIFPAKAWRTAVLAEMAFFFIARMAF